MASIPSVHPLIALAVGLLVGASVAGVGVAVVLRSRAARTSSGAAAGPGPATPPGEAALARRLLDLMDPAVVLLDADDAVLLANPSARALGIVRGRRLLVPALLDVAARVRVTGSRRSDVHLPGDLVGSGPRMVGVHGLRLDSGPALEPGPVALVLHDVTEARRVEATSWPTSGTS